MFVIQILLVHSLLGSNRKNGLEFHLIVGACDDLRIGGLTDDAADGGGVARQGMNVYLGSHVPNSCSGVTTAADENVDCRVKGKTVDGAQVTVVMTHNLIKIIQLGSEFWTPNYRKCLKSGL